MSLISQLEKPAPQQRSDKGLHTRRVVGALFLALRPQQWVKNTLVFGGLIFSQSLSDLVAVQQSVGAFIAFSLASSGIYLLNDLCDLQQDRLHPTKRRRPLAAGDIQPWVAGVCVVVLIGGALVLASAIATRFLVVIVAYLVINAGYSFGLKRIAIVDVMIIAFGFVLRAIGGAAAIGVHASPWLILCTLMLALLVGFGKRRHELALLEDNARKHRASLGAYTLPFLDLLMGISAAASIVTYALYTLADDTLVRFGSHNLILTIPWVLYGVFRYLHLVLSAQKGGDPARLFVTDVPTLLNVGLWVTVVCFLIYAPAEWTAW